MQFAHSPLAAGYQCHNGGLRDVLAALPADPKQQQQQQQQAEWQLQRIRLDWLRCHNPRHHPTLPKVALPPANLQLPGDLLTMEHIQRLLNYQRGTAKAPVEGTKHYRANLYVHVIEIYF